MSCARRTVFAQSVMRRAVCEQSPSDSWICRCHGTYVRTIEATQPLLVYRVDESWKSEAQRCSRSGGSRPDHQLHGLPGVIPMLSFEDVARAADWIANAFGFRETGRWVNEDGRVTHLNMELDGGVVMLGYPSPAYQSPRHHAEVCEIARVWSETRYVVDGVLVYVDDIEAHFERAQASGAAVLSPLEDNLEVGQRSYRAEDVEGHRWMFALPI